MTSERSFWRAFLVTAAIGAPLVFWGGVADGAVIVKEPPCRNLSTSGPVMDRGMVSYTAGAYCPEATYVMWTLSINRSGVRWASRSGMISQTPTVSHRCIRRGPPVTLRAVLRIDSVYAAGVQHSRTYRGAVVSVRCAP